MVMCKLQREYYSSAMYIERTYKIDGNVRKIFMPEQKAGSRPCPKGRGRERVIQPTMKYSTMRAQSTYMMGWTSLARPLTSLTRT